MVNNSKKIIVPLNIQVIIFYPFLYAFMVFMFSVFINNLFLSFIFALPILALYLYELRKVEITDEYLKVSYYLIRFSKEYKLDDVKHVVIENKGLAAYRMAQMKFRFKDGNVSFYIVYRLKLSNLIEILRDRKIAVEFDIPSNATKERFFNDFGLKN